MLYPKISETRELYDLNGIWNLEFDDKNKILVAVPGSFNDQVADTKYKNYVGNLNYSKKFNVSKSMIEKNLFIRFGSVAHFCEIFINNNFVGSYKGGFLPFEFNISKYVKIGENEILVKANNILDNTTLPVGNYKEIKTEDGNIIKKVDENFDFFNYAGIHRPVKLWTKPYSYIEDITINYDFIGDDVNVYFNIETVGKFSKVNIKIYDEDNKLVAFSNGENNQTLKIEKVKRWEILNSYLYSAKVELLDENNEIVDSYIEEFGVRSLEIKNNKLYINEKSVYLKGFGKHEDTYLHGRGLDEVANVSDIQRMKWIGANSFRTSHYPYSEEMMRLADREGFLVIDETSAVGLFENFGFSLQTGKKQKNTWETLKTKEAHIKVIKELIKRDKNHACVIMWSIANEPASSEIGAYEYFKDLFDLARKEDVQKRPCVFVNLLLAPAGKCLVMELSDIICLNRYYGWYVDLSDLETAKKNMIKELELWHKLYPDKPIMFTEYGVDTIAGLHDIDNRMPFTEEFQLEYYKMNEEVFDSLDYFIGEQTWNFADFQTKYGIFRVQGNKKGVFTRERNPKLVAHHLKDRWNKIPNNDYKK